MDTRDTVRVTIEGRVLSRYGREAIRVGYGHASALLATNVDGIKVEDVIPDRQWSDGDVVSAPGNHVLTFTRCAALFGPETPWANSLDRDYLSDADITDWVDEGAPVLRYRKGGQ